MKKYSWARLHSFAQVLGDTKDDLTGFEIEHLLKNFRIKDTVPTIAKWMRLFYTFTEYLNRTSDDSIMLEFIKHAIDLVRRVGTEVRYETLRKNLNNVFFLEGLTIDEEGNIYPPKFPVS